jgi:hypothetical protein
MNICRNHYLSTFARVLVVFVLVSAGLIDTGLCTALELDREFSARAIQKMPDRPTLEVQMYVSTDAVRTESVLNGEPIVELVFPKEETHVLLMPQRHAYVKQQAEQVPSALAKLEVEDAKPCTGMPDTQCRMLGIEEISGRKAEKWEFIVNRNGQTQRSLHWIDVERRMPLREFLSDGTATELHFLKMDSVNGRKTEKWKMTINRADGQKASSLQWYDPQLKIAIREELPGGYVRELTDIQIGPQPKRLFVIPDDYQRLQQPPPELFSAPGGPR